MNTRHDYLAFKHQLAALLAPIAALVDDADPDELNVLFEDVGDFATDLRRAIKARERAMCEAERQAA